ncbi:MAG TPA: hypothetical protein VKU60_10085, partial [Chloroflexota bacterium]|nr:hypothetical protein [Chloroflexota bacterium]
MTPAQSPTTPWSGYSQAERDRRWAAVRQNAARAGFDCTFVPLGNGPDAKYLTQFKTATVLLPTDGREPIVITDEPTGNNWLAETRGCTRAWSQWTIDAIADLGLERARIGVAGLKGGTVTHVRFPDGVVNHTTF